ncbi:hypothetical protein BGX38DRAFT_1160811 [Terfezia claveryi]|nr:hypothetical protein BGX38DRAFT_1160811 [Terfezia claveryi]
MCRSLELFHTACLLLLLLLWNTSCHRHFAALISSLPVIAMSQPASYRQHGKISRGQLNSEIVGGNGRHLRARFLVVLPQAILRPG